MTNEKIVEDSINAIRFLSADAIQKASSGHPGLPLGCAALAYEIFANHINHTPKNPAWENRDRFILSGGHGSMLLYSILHLFGYENMDIEAIKNFRQENSNTPGHPEYGHTIGVEATTGPLGQGMAMAVGMAIASEHMAATFNKENFKIVDNYTYVLGGDGCLMEGISSEAFSLAGDLALSKLIVLYDSNQICIEGSTDGVFGEDVAKRMEAFGFNVLFVNDGNDLEEISVAIQKAKSQDEKPSFIIVKTKIGFGCPNKEGSEKAHGEPLGEENIALMKENFNWKYDKFEIPKEVYAHYKEKLKRTNEAYEKWTALIEEYKKEYPKMWEKWEKYHTPINVYDYLEEDDLFEKVEKDEATRSSSGVILNKLANKIENIIGGSADLAPSNKSFMDKFAIFSKKERMGRNIRYGVREQAMAAIANGIALYGGLKTYVATFFVFSDYTKPMARLSALMKLPITYIYTHDSIGVGEDGPTHEPIEQLAQFRAMPGMTVIRPCDRKETAAAWKYAIESVDEPVALVLTRQNLAQQENSTKDISKGAYILQKESKDLDVILMSSGSEVAICVEAAKELEKEGISTRVVSIPSFELFDRQSESYKESILPKTCRNRVSIEAASTLSWGKYVGLDGKSIGIDTFGASAPAKVLFEHFKITKENVVESAKKLLEKNV